LEVNLPRSHSFRLRAVVFDLDGVIVDSHPIHRIAWKDFLRSVGKEVDESALDFVLDGRTRKEILLHFLGPLTGKQLDHYGHLKDELLRTLTDKMRTIPGVVEFFENLSYSGVRMALATSASRQRACGTLNELGIAHHFRTVVTGDDVAAGKPDPAIYLLAAKRLKFACEGLLAVEDAVSGVRSATAAGIRCIGVAPPERAAALQSAGADFVISDFRDLSVEEIQARLQSRAHATARSTSRLPIYSA
jgi:HAD superfamily hydrolase (TIGR01509 family)